MPLNRTSRISKLVTLAGLLLLPSLLVAQEQQRWYQVEIIIFSQNNPSYHTSEQWPQDYTLPDLEKGRNLTWPKGSNSSNPQPFTLLAKKDLKLDGAIKRIKSAGDVKLMLHLGWLQPGLEKKDAVAVHIYENMLNRSSQAVADGTPLKLDGTLRLTLARYLHLESDLVWREPLTESQLAQDNDDSLLLESAPGGNSEPAIVDNMNSEAVTEDGEIRQQRAYQVFRMQQSRRMRSSEIHYIDHPVFGIVALVTPYELAKPEKK